MGKKPLRKLREDGGAKACQVSRDTGIAASRLSAVENGYGNLSREEEQRVRQFLMRSAKERSVEQFGRRRFSGLALCSAAQNKVLFCDRNQSENQPCSATTAERQRLTKPKSC
jgi:transcriptional regulator with XRE-family HTH domain